MKLILSAKEVVVPSPYACSYTLQDDNFTYTVRVNGDIIYQGDPSTGSPSMSITFDGKGRAIIYTATPNNHLELDFDFHNPHDYLDLDVTIEGGAYNTFHKVFRIYGLDLTIPIAMLPSAYDGIVPINSHAHIVRPLSDRVNIYYTSNAYYSDIEYVDDVSNVLSTSEDFILTVDKYSRFRSRTITSVHNCLESSYTELHKTNWIPKIGMSVDCNLGCNECFTSLTDNIIHLYLNFSNVTHFDISGVSKEFGIYDYFGARYNLVGADNNHVFGWNTGVANPNTISPILPSIEFNTTEIGDFKALVQYDILNGYIMADTKDIVSGSYWVLNNNGDISNLTYSGTFANLEVINITVGGVPNNIGSMILIPVFDNTNYADAGYGYYKVLDATNVDVNGNTFSNDDVFFLNNGDVLTIGTDGKIVPMSTIYHCITSTTVKGCEVYDIKQSGCNEYTLTNRSMLDKTFNVYKLDKLAEDSWELKAEDNLIISGEEFPIAFIEDGVYKVVIDGVNLIVVNTCDLETCKRRFLNKLLCCGEDIKCGENDAVKFSSREFYAYNAFMLIVNTLYHILNMEYGYYESHTTISQKHINIYHEVDLLLRRAKEYCAECEDCDKLL